METTMKMSKSTPAMLYVNEVGTSFNRTGRASSKVLYTTWCVGVKIGNLFYVKQESLGDLLYEDEILVVNTGKCYRCTHDAKYSDFLSYAYDTQPDRIPAECHDLSFVTTDEVDPAILEELQQAYELYQNIRVSA